MAWTGQPEKMTCAFVDLFSKWVNSLPNFSLSFRTLVCLIHILTWSSGHAAYNSVAPIALVMQLITVWRL